MFLIFDTETTGLPRNYNAPLSDFDNWPRMVQIAWQLHDKAGKLLQHDTLIIRPEGYTIPFNAVQVHGITTERALEEGKNLQEVLNQFKTMVETAEYLCGHNIEFDINIIGAEFLRCGLDSPFTGKTQLDTKNDATTNYCALPGGRGGKFKWPTLSELYFKVFESRFEEAHNAAFDVQATSRVLFELLKRRIISVKDLSAEEAKGIHFEDVDLTELLQKEKQLKEKKGTPEQTQNIQVSKPEANVLPDVPFSHLHNHSQYSVLQSVTEVAALVKKAADQNMEAVALSDHGNMYATFLFWQSVDKQNKSIKAHNEAIQKGEKSGEPKKELKCLIGCELNITKDRNNKSKQDNGFSVPFIAKNKKGYENLSKLSSIGFTEGMYYVPRIDKEVLLTYKNDLICFSGGLNAEIPWLILNAGEAQAEEAFLWYKEQFGDDFYVELNRHGLPEEDHVNTVLLGFAKKHGVNYFAANSNYYLEKKSAYSRDILISVKE